MLRLGDNKIFPENTRHIFDIDIETDLFHLHEKSLIIVGMFSRHPLAVDGELVGSWLIKIAWDGSPINFLLCSIVYFTS